MHASSTVEISGSTLAGNSTAGQQGEGGAMFSLGTDLRTIDADGSAPGNQVFQFVVGAALSRPAQLHVEAFDGDFLVTSNVDADAAADFAIVVRTGLAGLRASDFPL